MQALLIDTNIWTGLLDEKDGADTLAALEPVLSQQSFILLLPSPIPDEWKKHYQSRVPSLKNEVRNQLKPLPPGLLDIVELAHSNAAQMTLELAQRIERVFTQAQSVSTSDEVRVEVMKRFEASPREAPFHNNSSSHNDARIYLSSAEWCLKNDIDVLHFVTDNHKDFADHARNYQGIHPGLVKPGLTVRYYGSLKQLVALINPTHEAVKELSRRLSAEKLLKPIVLTNNASLLAQWKEYWQFCFSHLPSIPKSLLARLFPIRVSEHQPASYYNTTIETYNQSLIETLRAYGVHPITEYQNGIQKRSTPTARLSLDDDLRFVFHQLNRSLINTIHSHEGHEDFDVHIGNQVECNCVRCLYERLDFTALFNVLLNEPSTDVDENMKNGYVHFKLGNQLKAFRFFRHAYRQSRKRGLWVRQLICAQNLVELQSKIEWQYAPQNRESHKSISVNVDDIFWANLHRDDFVRESSRLVYLNYFFDDAYYRIEQHHRELSRQYDSQLSGGWSSNQHLNQLQLAAGELGNFITVNSIISHYAHARFEELYKLVVESYFRCHAFNEHQSSRIEAFNDGLLIEIAANSSPKSIRDKLWQVYNRSLRYKKRVGQPSLFVERTVSFVCGLATLSQTMEKYGEPHYGATIETVWTRNTGSLLTLAAVLELNKSDAKQIATAVVEALSSVVSLQKVFREVDGITSFVLSKHRAFSIQQLKTIVAILATEVDKQKANELLEALGAVFREHYPHAIAKSRTSSAALTDAMLSSPRQDDLTGRKGVICEWYASLHRDDQVRITNRIEETLSNCFSRDLYYQCALYGVVGYKKWFEEYIQHVTPPSNQRPNFFGGTSYSTSLSLNALCNLAFKYNVDTTSPLFDRFKGQSDYYDWLLDMDNFDYSRFNEEWVVEYRTSIFLKKIFSNPTCRNAIKAKLEKRFQPRIAEYFIKYS